MSKWNNLERVLERFVREGTLKGCGMQVFHDNQMVFNHCVGSSTADGTKLLTEDTRLRLHSMSKTFTCAALMTLYDRGLFALDDPIAAYLPEFSNPMVCVSDTDINDVVPAKTPITIRQLLSMRSGLTYWAFGPGEGPVQNELLNMMNKLEQDVRQGKKNDLESFIKLVAKKPLCAQPGEKWIYGLSHAVAGRLIEVLSGKRLSEYLRETIWEPLELTRTCFVSQIPEGEEIAELMVSKEIIQPLGLKVGELSSSGETKDAIGSKMDVLPGTNIGIELPCGGMTSTLHDLGRYYSMFANGGEWNGHRILNRRTLDLMRTNELSPEQLPDFDGLANNRGFGYGLGYRTMMSAAKAGFYLPKGSFGWDGACGCYGLANPDSKFSFVFVEQSLPHHIDYTIPRVVAAMNTAINL